MVQAGTRRRLDATVLRRLLHTRGKEGLGRWLERIDLLGAVDLAGIDIGYSLRLVDGRLEQPLVLHGATVPALTVKDSHMPGLLANGIRVTGDVDLSGSVIDGLHPSSASTSVHAAVWLCESDIGGRGIGENVLNTGSTSTGKTKDSRTTKAAAPAAPAAHHQRGTNRVSV